MVGYLDPNACVDSRCFCCFYVPRLLCFAVNPLHSRCLSQTLLKVLHCIMSCYIWIVHLMRLTPCFNFSFCPQFLNPEHFIIGNTSYLLHFKCLILLRSLNEFTDFPLFAYFSFLFRLSRVELRVGLSWVKDLLCNLLGRSTSQALMCS